MGTPITNDDIRDWIDRLRVIGDGDAVRDAQAALAGDADARALTESLIRDLTSDAAAELSMDDTRALYRAVSLALYRGHAVKVRIRTGEVSVEEVAE